MRSFNNLTGSQAFLDSNFSNFFADDNPGLSMEEVGQAYISARLSEPDSPEPYFWSVLPTTLSEACCASFLRHHRLPALPRDYYLSKLYQFVFEAFRCVYRLEDPATEVARTVHQLLGQIPDTHLPPSRPPADLAEIFEAVYSHITTHSLDESMAELEAAITTYVAAGPGVRVRNGRRGRPAIPVERKEAAYQAKLYGKTGRDQAALLYGVSHPTREQIKNTSKVLQHHLNKTVPRVKQ